MKVEELLRFAKLWIFAKNEISQLNLRVQYLPKETIFEADFFIVNIAHQVLQSTISFGQVGDIPLGIGLLPLFFDSLSFLLFFFSIKLCLLYHLSQLNFKCAVD